MSHFKEIYSYRAKEYERLVAREDYHGNIKPALGRIRPLAGLDVVDLGAGTGRITRLLAPEARHITALDISPHMLDVARALLIQDGATNWRLAAADNRQLPLKDQTADLAIAGWSLGHSVGWYPESWRDEIGRALAEMARVLRPDGTIILLETLGTNRERPRPPTPDLAEFFAWLEEEEGFERAWIRTDYAFASVQEAVNLTHFFFGEAMAEAVAAANSPIVPECTGIWSRMT